MASDSRTTNFRNRNVGGHGNSRRSPTPCRFYFNSGSCRDGSRCRYSHDRNLANLCKFYQRGNCHYGESCRYEHVRPLNNSEERTASASVGSSSRASSSLANIRQLTHLMKKTTLRADAQEFVPASVSNGSSDSIDEKSATNPKDILCPYHILGHCWYGTHCSFTHGTICDLCDRAVLHPNDAEMNRKHREECLAEHERDMQVAFAMARAKEKTCGICMEVIMEKANVGDRRFGILPNCRHSFCLSCLRKWRQSSFENKVIRACPECRTVSDFVAPSAVWVEDEEEKRLLFDGYKAAMKEKSCKYFRDGQVECPFGNKCFYRHVKPDGTIVRGDSPRTIRRRQRRRERRERGAFGDSGHGPDFYFLWDILEENDWRGSRFSLDEWPGFQPRDELDWLSISDSESDFYDY